jgi:hypothetical protein
MSVLSRVVRVLSSPQHVVVTVKEQRPMENAQIQPRRLAALRIATTIAQMLIGISGPTALVLGVLF